MERMVDAERFHAKPTSFIGAARELGFRRYRRIITGTTNP